MDEQSILARLQRLDSCALSDALDQLGLRGVAVGLHRLSSERRVVGRTRIVALQPAPANESSSHHLATRAIEAAVAGDVLIIANDARLDVAAWGGLLAASAKAHGIAGVIIDGAFRDVDECRALDLAVYARGVVPASARGRVREKVDVQTVTISGTLVSDHDWVLADSTGVVFVPASIVATVVASAERIVLREQDLLRALASGRPPSEVMGLTYESMLAERNGDTVAPATDDACRETR